MLETSYYRRNYTGEVVSRGNDHFLVKPKKIYHRENDSGKAIVVGNGITRNNQTFDVMLTNNRNRPLIGYKIVYACNGAAWDLPADYYVINDRILLAHMDDEKIWNKFFLPYDLFLDYNHANMMPILSGMDAGSMALFLACFDGNDEIFMFGFDGEEGDNVYRGKPCYEQSKIDQSTWESNIATIMQSFPNHRFYRIGSGRTPASWTKLPNFQDSNYKEAVYLGDF